MTREGRGVGIYGAVDRLTPIEDRFAKVGRNPLYQYGHENLQQIAQIMVHDFIKDGQDTAFVMVFEGLPGSTKTTTAAEMATYVAEHTRNTIFINSSGEHYPRVLPLAWDQAEIVLMGLMEKYKDESTTIEQHSYMGRLVNEVNVRKYRRNWATTERFAKTAKDIRNMQIDPKKPFPELALMCTEIILSMQIADLVKAAVPYTFLILDKNAGTQARLGRAETNTRLYLSHREYGQNMVSDLVNREGMFKLVSEKVRVGSVYLTVSPHIDPRLDARDVILSNKQTLQANLEMEGEVLNQLLKSANLAGAIIGSSFSSAQDLLDFSPGGSLEQVFKARYAAASLVKKVLVIDAEPSKDGYPGQNEAGELWKMIPDYLRYYCKKGLDDEFTKSIKNMDQKTAAKAATDLYKRLGKKNQKVAQHMYEAYEVARLAMHPHPLHVMYDSLYILAAALMHAEDIESLWVKGHKNVEYFNGYVEVPSL